VGNFILKVAIGNGYKPHRVLYWVASIVFALGMLFDWGYNRGDIVPTKETIITSETYQSTRKLLESSPSFNGAFRGNQYPTCCVLVRVPLTLSCQ
jgi:hypothetical protein